MFRRFFHDLITYRGYAFHAAKASLKAEVAGSYLNWLWWIINPLSFMGIYSFIFGVVFHAKEQCFPVYIFIGLTMWDFFSHTATHAVRMIRNSKTTITKVYLPKFILLLSDMLVSAFKMMISWAIVFLMLAIYRVKLTLAVLMILPVLAALFVFSFMVGIFLMHLGVYIQDLPNIVTLALRLLFYLTGIFYNILTRIPEPWCHWILRLNPMASFITQARCALLSGTVEHWRVGVIAFAVSLVLSALGVRLVYKNENGYIKVI